MRRSSLLIVVCVIVTFLLGLRAVEAQADKSVPPAEPTSMLPNAGFETTDATGLPYGWSRWPKDLPNEVFTTTDENPAAGKLCLKYDLTNYKYPPEQSGKNMDRGREFLDQTGPSFNVDMAKAKRYRLTYYYKADKKPEPAICLVFSIYKKDTSIPVDGRVHEPIGTGAWEKASVEFTLPEGATAVRIQPRGYLGTKIYLDNIVWEPITEPN